MINFRWIRILLVICDYSHKLHFKQVGKHIIVQSGLILEFVGQYRWHLEGESLYQHLWQPLRDLADPDVSNLLYFPKLDTVKSLVSQKYLQVFSANKSILPEASTASPVNVV